MDITIIKMTNGVGIKVALMGDISLNNAYTLKSVNKLSNIFLEVKEYLDSIGINVVIGNLESALEGNGRENILKCPRLHTNISALESVKILAPDILVLANNHIYDCLEKGFINTRHWLKRNNICYTGAGLNFHEATRPCKIERNGERISLLAYVAKDTNPCLPNNCKFYLNFLQSERVIEDIKKVASEALVIVSVHWGIEFSHYPSPKQRKLAHAFVEAGASIVVGHHSHCLQGFEKWGLGYIFYGLGNFAFADILNAPNPVLWTEDQRHAGIAIVYIRNGKVDKAQLVPTFIDNLIVKIEKHHSWVEEIETRSRPLKWLDERYNRFWEKHQFIGTIIKPPFRYFFGERKRFYRQLTGLRFKHFLKLLQYLRTFYTKIRL